MKYKIYTKKLQKYVKEALDMQIFRNILSIYAEIIFFLGGWLLKLQKPKRFCSNVSFFLAEAAASLHNSN